MKKVLICISDFRQGGIPRCLQTLLMNVDVNKVSIDLLCLSKGGFYSDKMTNCRIVKNDYILSNLLVHTKKIKINNIIKSIPAIIFKLFRFLLYKVVKKDLLINRINYLSRRLGEYDSAIAYAEGYPALIVERIKSLNKLVWIHNDYAFEGARGGIGITNFLCFNKICCVSNATMESFVALYPQLRDKTQTIYNLTNVDFIIEQSKEEINDVLFDNSLFTIVSIGRICAQKRFYVIPEVAKVLRQHGVYFKWYIIGGGPKNEVDIVKKEIHKNNVEENVFLLGECNNPYKYLNKSNLFVLTSLYESYPTVINEARVLKIPIVSVNIKPILEMLGDNEAVVAPLDKIASAIINLYNDKNRYEMLKSVPFKDKNKELINLFYNII